MSKIFVKWNELSRGADSYKSCANELKKCAERVNNVKGNLHLSADVSAQIKNRLGKDYEQIMRVSEEMHSSAVKLADIAKLYQETERGMLDK